MTTRTQETSPRRGQEPIPSASSSASLLDDWDLLFEGEEPAAPSPEVEAEPVPTAIRFLGFRVGPQLYAVALAELSEVVRDAEITPVPRLRPFVRGIVSVRGTIVPIVDLRRRLAYGVDAGPSGRDGIDGTSVGVCEAGPCAHLIAEGGGSDVETIGSQTETRSVASLRRILITSFGGESFGLLVDEVTHPFALEPHEVEPPPVTLPRRLHDLVLGIGRVEDCIHILLDLSVVLRFDAVLPQRVRGEGGHE